MKLLRIGFIIVVTQKQIRPPSVMSHFAMTPRVLAYAIATTISSISSNVNIN